MKTTTMKKKLYACILILLLGSSLLTGCQTGPKRPIATALLPEERDSITIGSLSPDHIYYNEVIGLDPNCKNYIQELSIYDAEIDDTFLVHISLPPNYDETHSYPMIVMTDGVWRLSDHPELRPLMVNGTIKDIIMVSIGYPNGYDYQTIRERDLVDAPDAYLHFIVDNLVPYLEEIYSVDAENMTLTGHSLGGYWAYYALFHSDTIGKNTFQNYYVGSPSMWASTDGTTMTAYEEEYCGVIILRFHTTQDKSESNFTFFLHFSGCEISCFLL